MPGNGQSDPNGMSSPSNSNGQDVHQWEGSNSVILKNLLRR